MGDNKRIVSYDIGTKERTNPAASGSNIDMKTTTEHTKTVNTIHCLNTRGLFPLNYSTKPKVLCDKLMNENSLIAFMSETWLTNDMCDAELMYDDYVNFRGDGEGRNRGAATRTNSLENNSCGSSCSIGCLPFSIKI